MELLIKSNLTTYGMLGLKLCHLINGCLLFEKLTLYQHKKINFNI